MTLRKIALWGHPVLLEPAVAVDDAGAPDVGALIDDMLATLDDIGGRGLAAPQVYDGRRVVLAQATRAEPALVLVNPVLDLIGAADALGFEGCLSIPGLRGVVPRHARLTYRGLDRDGRPVGGEAEGMLARILQHEVDHLDGILYPMRLPSLAYMGFEAETTRMIVELNEGERR